MISFAQPAWLLLLIPLAAALWRWPMPTRLLSVLRAALLVVLLIALAGLSIRLPSRAGTVILLADRSRSMPAGNDAAQREAIELLRSSMRSGDRLGVVTFAERAVIEQAPQAAPVDEFTTDHPGDGSNLAAALDQALALVPPDAPGRVVVLSDGRWTGRDPLAAASRAAGRRIAIDYRAAQRASAGDLAIASIETPPSVYPREAFMITGFVRSPAPQEIRYELRRGSLRIAQGVRQVPSGVTRLTFRDIAEEPGALPYTLVVRSAADDPTPENNTARAIVGVEGARPILFVTRKQPSSFAGLLQRGGLNLRVRTPQQAAWSLTDLAGYSSVIIDEVPAGDIGVPNLQNLADWVRSTASGVMLTGGQSSYGPGGYFKSPLDPILPVSMELKREHRKHALAMVIALDRSGSMMAPLPDGRRKMDLADLAAASVVDMLTPMDELGILAVDSQAHTIAALQHVTDPADLRDRILRIESMGGGIFVYEALIHAVRMLQSSKAGTRHIILFADAADAEEPGRYKELLAECQKAGITVTTIGLGTERDVDADLLKDIAARGGGRSLFTEQAQELPRLFAQDTFIVARNSFIDEPTALAPAAGLTAITGAQITEIPGVGGYNLTYLRDDASVAVQTTDEYKAPLVASWTVGSGRALAYTGQADGKFTGAIANWNQAGSFFTSLARWTAGERKELPGGMMLTQQQREGVATVTLHLDPNRTGDALGGGTTVTLLRGLPGRAATTERATLQWVSPDELALDVVLGGEETVIATVDVPGHGPVAMPPVTQPYSPEFKPVSDERGEATLRALAAATGGAERVSLGGVWSDLPRNVRLVPLASWLYIAAVVLLLLETLERRTGVLSLARLPKVRWRRLRREQPVETTEKPVTRTTAATAGAPTPKPAPNRAAPPPAEVAPPKEDPAPSKEPAPSGGTLDALAAARQRAQQRTDRK